MRTIALLILALTASSVLSTCAGDNFVSNAFTTTAFAFTVDSSGTGNVPTNDDVCGFKTASTSSCCGDAVIDEFQNAITAIIEDVQETAGQRDEFILEKRGDVIELRDSLNKLAEVLERAADQSGVSLDAYEQYTDLFGVWAESVLSNFTGLVANLKDYQVARKECMETLFTAQVSVWCAACEDGFDTAAGVTITDATTGEIEMHDDLIATIRGDCYNYIAFSAAQSQIISLASVADGIAALASLLEKVLNGETPTADDLAGLDDLAPTTPTNVYERPSTIPSACTSTACAWVETGLFTSGYQINQNAAILGGEQQSLSFSRILKEGGNERRLAGTTGYNPTLSDISAVVTFAENPADIDLEANSSLSALRNGVVAVAVAALALFF